MNLRARIISYLVALHVVCAGAVVWLARDSPASLVAIELGFIVSLAIGITLAGRFVTSAALGDDAARLIREGDVTTRLRPVGDTRLDGVINAYNTMVDALRAERARIQEQHHFFEQVVTATPMGMVVLDFDGRIDVVNPAASRLLGVARQLALGKTLAELSSPLAKAAAALSVGDAEVTVLTGARRVRSYRGAFVDRGFPRTFYIIEELTEEARDIERAAYEKIIRVMSHEVNNSITASNSLLQSSLTYAAELSPSSRTDMEQALGIVIERTEQLNRFMRRFADVFRLPAPTKAPTDLRAALAPIVTLLRSRPDAVGVTWEWDAPARGPLVSVDRVQFEQAALNILKNAIEAAGPIGRVVIRIFEDADGVTLVVEDSGAGPTPEAQAHLFTPFFSTKPNGQGIGLTLIQEIFFAHGFEYALEHPPGGVTRFVVKM